MKRQIAAQRESEPYEAVAIVGLGLMGGSLALSLKRAGYAGRILGVSRPETVAEARRLGAIDEGFTYEQLASAVEPSRLIVLASPISAIIKHLEALGGPGVKLRPKAFGRDRRLPITNHWAG
jgi:prephenate dehydrogenase